MKRARLLDPRGTLRTRFDAPADGPPFPAGLERALIDSDVPPEHLLPAWELARLEVGLAPSEQDALMLLALATAVGVRQGSTRIPLPSGVGLSREDRGYLDDLLVHLGIGAERRAAVSKLANAPENLRTVVGHPGAARPLVVEGGFLYQQRMQRQEARLVAALEAHLARPALRSAAVVAPALAAVLARPPSLRGAVIQLSDEQQVAVRAALCQPLTVISGGPGTGKTSIIVSILRTLARLGIPAEAVALAAPTGKAAHRMDESIQRSLAAIPQRADEDDAILAACPEPRTLHRLLGYSPSTDRFKHHGRNRLAEKVVIVDECSMIDLYLMDALVRAVGDDAQLILLGDADQLPSVEAGSCFRDLLPSPATPDSPTTPAAQVDPRATLSVRLTRSYRMDPSDPAGRAILTAGQHINAGHGAALFTGAVPLVDERATPSDVVFDRVELLPGGSEPAQREAFLERWLAERIQSLPDFDSLVRRVYHHGGHSGQDGAEGFPVEERRQLAALFRHFESARILCITRGAGRPTGADAINAHLHRRILAAARTATDGAPTIRPAFVPGEPVMMQRNDYDRGLFNGDQGIILRVAQGSSSAHHFMAVFPHKDDFSVFQLDSLRDEIKLSFAMTVHKGQGSEFDHVALILPDEDLPLLTREILYTGLTRSRRSVVIVGRREVLLKGVEARIRRFSGVGERLAGCHEDGV